MSSAALAVMEGGNNLGAVLQAPAHPQMTSPTIVPLDRDSLQFYASMITMANLVPVENNVPAEVSKSRVMAKIVSGASYGFDPILAQSCYDVLFNRLTLNATAMEILFRDSGEYDSRIIELNDQTCRVDVLKRVGGEWINGILTGGTWSKIGTVEFTYDMAEKAGLTKSNPNWMKFRQDMLYSKVAKRMVKRFNPACLRPRTLLGNYFAKAHQAPAPMPEAAPVPQLPVAAPGTLSAESAPVAEYVDEPYIASDYVAADDAAEAAVVEYTTDHIEPGIHDKPEDTEPELDTATENLRAQVQELYDALPKTQGKDWLAGKTPTTRATREELETYKTELEKLTA
jgi:hypothetical protein